MRGFWTSFACAAAIVVATAPAAAAASDSSEAQPSLASLARELRELRNEVSELRRARQGRPAAPPAPAGGDRPAHALDVTDFGAVGDGRDDTAAFQRALDAAGAGGNAMVGVPAGTYTIRGHLSVPPNTELRGANDFPYRTWGSTNRTNQGTTLQAFEGAGCADPASAPPFVMLNGPNSGIAGMSVVYPDQAGPEAKAPVPYPWCIRGSGDDVTIKNMFLVNPFLGIDLGTQPAGRHLVSDVYGNPLKTGIFVDQCFDVGRIRHIHFWNFWASDPTPGPGGAPKVVGPLQQWISTNGVTVQLARTDWEVLEDVFSWGYAKGLLLTNSTVTDPKTRATIGACNGQFTDIQFDAVDVGVDVQATDPFGVFFSNLNLANAGCWQEPASGCNQIGVRCAGACCYGSAVVRGASMWGAFKQAVAWSGPAFLTLTDSTVETWDPNLPAVSCSAGRIAVRGCTFGVQKANAGAVAVSIGPGVDRAIVLGNDLLGATVQSQVPAANAVVASNLA